MLVGIQEEILRLHSMGLLKQLLVDKTTKANLIWATDAYQELGSAYERDKEMQVSLITGQKSDVIKNRARKAMEQQSERTRKHAEVFTPLWICQKMVSHADAIWFGGSDGFLDGDQPVENVIFSEQRTWQQYVDAKRLEITCGEAPYLVNRYDVSTGEIIPLKERQGVLDRKLRVVNENISEEVDWIAWVLRAFQATYGYEFQGDNVLIARVNLLMTFEEYLKVRWNRNPTAAEYREIIKTIVWNIWQMDGLSGTIPYCKAEEEYHQFSLFEWFDTEEYQEKINQQPHCRIYNWRSGGSLEYQNVNKGGKRNMKFDFVIGNPPYQEDTDGAGRQARPLYNCFIESVKDLNPEGMCLITPSRWFSGGMGLDSFRESMMNDDRIACMVDFTNAKDCFPNISISGGVNYFVWKSNYHGLCSFTNTTNGETSTRDRKLNEFPVLVRYNHAVDIIHKVCHGMTDKLAIITSGLMPFGLSTSYRGEIVKTVENNITLYASNCVTYVSKNEISKGIEYLEKYSVMISKTSAEHAGEPGKDGMFRVIPSSIRVIGPNEVCTHSYFLIGCFDEMTMANNALSYMKTRFTRFLMLMSMSGFGLSKLVLNFVPLQDFTSTSDIDWSQSIADIDCQLYRKYGLDDDEIKFIETHVKEMV